MCNPLELLKMSEIISKHIIPNGINYLAYRLDNNHRSTFYYVYIDCNFSISSY